MDATWGERFRVSALRIMCPRGQEGVFKRAPIWSALMGITNFATRTAASAGIVAVLKPIGIAIALLVIVWFGWDALADILRAMATAS